ncbi:hypothetical protein C8K18_109257 [Paraburkholderia sp. GV068]|nr:hypothetical protein C8K19_109256 [Paraburkholderia sp. GV072]PUB02933.1 hypothetical protein C8K18_109257 [Paraburkholderia sp. GV068]
MLWVRSAFLLQSLLGMGKRLFRDPLFGLPQGKTLSA